MKGSSQARAELLLGYCERACFTPLSIGGGVCVWDLGWEQPPLDTELV